MSKDIFQKQTFLSITGEPINQLKEGKVNTTIILAEHQTKEEAQKNEPNGTRIRKVYEFTLDDYQKHGDDLYKIGLDNDPQLQKI